MINPTLRAALFSTDFLAFSQAFVYEELIHHQRWEMEVFAHNRLNEDRFPFPRDRVHALNPAQGLSRRAEAALYGLTTWSPSHYRRLKEGRFSLLHAQFGPGGVYALTYKKLLGLPLMVTFGGYEVPLLQTRRRFWPLYWRYWLASGALFRNIDRFLPVSRDLASRLVELGAPPEKVHVYQRGIHIPEQISPTRSSSTNHIQILMVGRFVEKKGFEYGIRACARLLAQGCDIRLSLVGQGPLQPTYERLIQQEGLSHRISLPGSMSQEKLFAQMEKSDLVLVPSVTARNGDTEGTTNVLKEAMARGLPAVITRHGGNPDIVEDGRTGFIVEERDEETLAAQIGLLVSQPHLRHQMGQAARHKAQREFSFAARMEALEHHYDQVHEQEKSQAQAQTAPPKSRHP